jgi:hypothetical protein
VIRTWAEQGERHHRSTGRFDLELRFPEISAHLGMVRGSKQVPSYLRAAKELMITASWMADMLGMGGCRGGLDDDD